MSGSRRFAERVRHVAQQEVGRGHPGPDYFRVSRHHPLRLEALEGNARIDIADPDVTTLVRSRQLDEGDIVPVLTDQHGDYVILGSKGGGSPVSRHDDGDPTDDRDDGDLHFNTGDSEPRLWVNIGGTWKLGSANARGPAGGDLNGTYPDPGVNLKSGGGLGHGSGLMIALDTNPGLQLGAGGLSAKLDTNPGLEIGSGGMKVKLKTNGQLGVDADGLYADITLPPDPGYGTSLPADPLASGLSPHYYYVADATNRIVWHFFYDASLSAPKWQFVGGPPLRGYVAADQSTTTTGSWVDLTTTGPDVTIPLAGDYEFRFTANGWCTSQAGAIVQIGLAAAAGTPATPLIASGGAANSSAAPGITLTREMVETGLAANTLRRMRYQTPGTGGHWCERILLVTPIRVTGTA